MKTLLRKQVTPHPLRFHELSTILAEAIMNSRPMTPLHSTEVDDDLVLTPGHFLIGRPLKAPPAKSKISNLRRWALVHRLTQDLWTAWQGRYLQSLQARPKWTKRTRDFQEDDIVYVKDEVLKHRDWPLARIIKTFPGDDGRVRAVDVKCRGNVYRRPTNKLILLFDEDQPVSPSMFRTTPPTTSDHTHGHTPFILNRRRPKRRIYHYHPFIIIVSL